MIDLYTHRDLKNIFPWINPRTIIYWVERGLLKPPIDASGRGSSRKYSFKNLIEIAFMGELLRRGLPFASIKRIIESKEYKDIIENERWDYVLWEFHEIIPAPVPMHKGPPHASGCFSASIHDFVKKKSGYLLGTPPEKKRGGGYTYSITHTSSVIVISFYGLKNFVSGQVERFKSE